MARITLQIKNVASLLLAATASVCSGIAVRKFLEPHSDRWWIPATVGLLAIACQVLLIFVESKEEEELSLLRTQRLERSRHIIEEDRKLSLVIQKELEAGNHDSVERWHEVRRKLNG